MLKYYDVNSREILWIRRKRDGNIIQSQSSGTEMDGHLEGKSSEYES